MSLRLTILGCGSSGGVPRIAETPGGDWGACDPANPRNRRRRCSLLVEREGPGGTTRVLVDTSPDLREQLLSAGIARIDGVVWTHAHADHTHGIDDLRVSFFHRGARIPCWARPATVKALLDRFGYAFATPEGSGYPPICDLHEVTGAFEVPGPGGPIPIAPFDVEHGREPTVGLRIGPAAYLPDAVGIPEASWPALDGLDLWIVDALRRKPHPTHANLDMALEWIVRAAPKRAILTNMHNDLDHDAVAAETPAHVAPAFDGMVLTVPLA